jgi:uncharacterized protein YggU (UPF0235/DUF167 family)
LASFRLAVRLTPRGGRDSVDGWATDADGRPFLKVRVAAAPVDGQANEAMLRVLAKALQRPRAALRLVSGDAARLKQIEIDEITLADIAQVFGAPNLS